MGRCPACGEPVDVSASLHCDYGVKGRVRAPSPGAIDFGEPIRPEWNLRCTACGYNLTGLVSRVCPECGEPFKPRETWLANRQAAGDRVELRRRWLTPSTIVTFAAAILVAAVAHPVWPASLFLWVFLELNYWRFDLDPRLLRVFFVTCLLVSLVLLLF